MGLIDQLISYLLDRFTTVKDIFVNLFGLVILIMVIVGGVQYLTGNAEGGKKTIIAAIIGAAIVSLAVVIINSVSGLVIK